MCVHSYIVYMPAKVCDLDELAHLNTCFKHFLFFTMVRFRLISNGPDLWPPQ